jgi:hypothetical protein
MAQWGADISAQLRLCVAVLISQAFYHPPLTMTVQTDVRLFKSPIIMPFPSADAAMRVFGI